MFKCTLSGGGTSIVGDKKIIFDDIKNTVKLKDSGGIFGDSLTKSFPIPKGFIRSITNSDQDFEFDFFVQGFDGRFSVNKSNKDLIKYLILFFSGIPSQPPIRYFCSFSSDRGQDTYKEGWFSVYRKDHKIIFTSLDESPHKLNLDVSIDVFPLEENSIEISQQFIYNSEYYNSIIIIGISIKDFEYYILSATFEESKYIAKMDGGEISTKPKGVNHLIKLCGTYEGNNYNGYASINILADGIELSSISNDEQIEDFKFIIKFHDVRIMERINNFVICLTKENYIVMESDSYFWNDAVSQSYQLNALIDNSASISDCEFGFVEFSQDSIVAYSVVLGKDKLLISSHADKLELSYKDTDIISKQQIGASEYSFTLVTNKNNYSFQCKTSSLLLLDRKIEQFKKTSLGIKTEYFLHEEEVLAKKRVENYFIAKETILENHHKIKENLARPDLIGKTVMATKNQFSNLYSIVEEVSGLLDISMPEIYVFESFFYSIDAEGLNYPRLEVSNRILTDFTEDEIKFFVGSKMAHIACGNLETEVVIEGILEAIKQMDSIPFAGEFIRLIPTTQAIEMTFKIVFFDWHRKAIYSCDRFGLLYSGLLQSSIKTLLKLILNNVELVDQLNIRDYLGQKENLKLLNGIITFYAKADESIPYGQDRIVNLLTYYNSLTYEIASENLALNKKSKEIL